MNIINLSMNKKTTILIITILVTFPTSVTGQFFLDNIGEHSIIFSLKNDQSLSDCFTKGRGEDILHAGLFVEASIMMFDYENDGDIDLVKQNSLYLNEQGSFNKVKFYNESTLPSDLRSSPTHADFNNDGYEDMVCCINDVMRLFINTCKDEENSHLFDIFELFDFKTLTEEDFSANPYGITSADFNDDGLMDIAVGYRINFDINKIAIFFNQGEIEFIREDVFCLEKVDVELGGISDVEANDFDNDGDIDILFGYDTIKICNDLRIYDQGITCIIINNGDNTFSNLSVVAVRGIPIFIGGYFTLLWRDIQHQLGINRVHPQIATADFDNDGDIDVILGDNSGKIELFENEGNGHFNNPDRLFQGIISDFGIASLGISTGDYDNDGDIDFVVCGSKSNDLLDLDSIIYLKRNQLK